MGKIGENSQIIDKTGSIVATLEDLYFVSSKFIEGLAVVATTDNWKDGVIDTAGNVIVPLEYDSISDFNEGLARVSKGLGKDGFIDKTGNVVVPLEYSLVRNFNEGLAAVRTGMRPDCKWGILELTSEKASPPSTEIEPEGTNFIASEWAQDEIKKANELSLIPDSLKSEDLTKPVTRAEFAAVAVKVYEALSGVKAIPEENHPFTDTNDAEVLKAYNVGNSRRDG